MIQTYDCLPSFPSFFPLCFCHYKITIYSVLLVAIQFSRRFHVPFHSVLIVNCRRSICTCNRGVLLLIIHVSTFIFTFYSIDECGAIVCTYKWYMQSPIIWSLDTHVRCGRKRHHALCLFRIDIVARAALCVCKFDTYTNPLVGNVLVYCIWII